MSKKVRYAIGAVGLTPVAALFTPGTAMARSAQAGTQARPATKTVALGPAIPKSGGACVASIWERSPTTGSEYLGFWHSWYNSQSECIGTVKTHMSLTDFLRYDFWRIRVWDDNGIKFSNSKVIQNQTSNMGVHRLFRGHPNVCSALGSSFGGNTPIWHVGVCLVANNP